MFQVNAEINTNHRLLGGIVVGDSLESSACSESDLLLTCFFTWMYSDTRVGNIPIHEQIYDLIHEQATTNAPLTERMRRPPTTEQHRSSCASSVQTLHG